MNIRSLAIGVLSCVAALRSPAGAQQPTNPRFSDAFGAFGVDGTIASMVEWDPDGPGPQDTWLVVAGGFAHAGKVRATNIAAYDGERWRALGTLGGDFRATQPRTVQSVAVHEGVLYAGGTFETADGVNTGGFVRRVGDRWERVLPTGTLASPHAVGLLGTPDGLVLREYVWQGTTYSWSGGEQYMFRRGTLTPLRWQGAQLSRYLVFDGALHALVRQSATNTLLRWQGDAWTLFPVQLGVQDIFLSGGALFGTGAAGVIYAWDGVAWERMPDHPTNWQALSNAFDYDGHLAVQNYASDSWHNCYLQPGVLETFVLNGGVWSPLEHPLFVFPDRTYRGLPIANYFETPTWFLFGQDRIPIGEPADGLMGDTRYNAGHVYGLTNFAGRPVAWGSFRHARGRSVEDIAVRTPDGWRQLIPTVKGDSVLFAGASDRFLLANLNFQNPNQCNPTPIYRTERVTPTGSVTRVGYLDGYTIQAHAVDPATGDHVVSARVGTEGVFWLFRVTPTGLSILPTPFPNFQARALAFHNGRLHAFAGSALWYIDLNGAWQSFPLTFEFTGSGSWVHGMISHQGELYIHGAFSVRVDDRSDPSVGIVRWDGSRLLHAGRFEYSGWSWQSGIIDAVSFGNDLYAVGVFSSVDGIPVRNFARWDGTRWYNVGGGTNWGIHGIAAIGGALHLGGLFTEAGGHLALSNTIYTPNPCQADLNADGTPDLTDFFTFFDCFDRQDPCADVNDDTGVDLDDFFGFLDAYDRQCR